MLPQNIYTLPYGGASGPYSKSGWPSHLEGRTEKRQYRTYPPSIHPLDRASDRPTSTCLIKNFKISGTNRPNPDCIEISALMVHSLGLIYLADFPLARRNMLDFGASN